MSLLLSRSPCARKTCAIAFLLISASVSAFGAEWLTFGHDPQRTGWAFEETKLSPATVPNLGLKWKSKLKNEFYRLSALTTPVVVAGDVSTNHGLPAK
jgi:hypothetical protein